MKEELEEIIKKNLPAQVGDTLKKVLEKGKKDAEELDIFTNANRALKADVKTLEGRVEKYQEFDARNSALDAREKELEDKERNLEIELLKMRLDTQKTIAANNQEVAMGLVRNTEYRKHIFDNKPGRDPYYDANNNYICPPNEISEHTEEGGAK